MGRASVATPLGKKKFSKSSLRLLKSFKNILNLFNPLWMKKFKRKNKNKNNKQRKIVRHRLKFGFFLNFFYISKFLKKSDLE